MQAFKGALVQRGQQKGGKARPHRRIKLPAKRSADLDYWSKGNMSAGRAGGLPWFKTHGMPAAMMWLCTSGPRFSPADDWTVCSC
eukprot:1142491-Pelagomonas_calceolata.AAC.3